ncbi:MAG: lysylphosphatidylglycerol synthase transmembrane domain-containing protein, partial [Planctomycetaceae bacterium]
MGHVAEDSEASAAAATASPDRRKWHRTKSFQLLIGLAVTFGCLWLAARVMAQGRPLGEVLAEIGDAFSQANYASVPPILVILFIFYWIKAWRWRMLLVPLGDFSARTLFPPVMIGFAANNLLPAHLGDLVRVFVFSRQQKQPLTAVFTSVALERVLDAIAILVLLALGLLMTPEMNDQRMRTAMSIAAGVIGVALLGAAVYLIWTKPFVRAFERCLARIPLVPVGMKQQLARMVEQGAAGLASLGQRQLWAGLILTSLFQWTLNAVVIHLSLWSFGIHVSPLVSCIVMGATAFGVTVPASPGYFGVIQLCFLGVLRFFTDDAVGVGAASIYYHLVQWIPVTATGAYFFWRTGLRVADVTDEAVTPPAVTPV